MLALSHLLNGLAMVLYGFLWIYKIILSQFRIYCLNWMRGMILSVAGVKIEKIPIKKILCHHFLT